MTAHPDRKGFEFSKGLKNQVKRRSNGLCEWAEGCYAKGRIFDHLTSIKISRLLNHGYPDKSVTSIENAQHLCQWHNSMKTFIEEWMTKQLIAKTAF